MFQNGLGIETDDLENPPGNLELLALLEESPGNGSYHEGNEVENEKVERNTDGPRRLTRKMGYKKWEHGRGKAGLFKKKKETITPSGEGCENQSALDEEKEARQHD